MTGEIPVATVIGYGLVEAVDALEHDVDRCRHAAGPQHLNNLAVDLLHGERLVDGAHGVVHLGNRLLVPRPGKHRTLP